MSVPNPLILSLSPFDAAQGDPEALEGSKDEHAGSWFDKPVLSESKGSPRAVKYLEARATDGGTSVLWSDLWYCWPTAPSQGSIGCALWFGGIFGPDGHAVTQVVKVGGWVQRRPASR
jgi:hypothetical protein